MSSWECYGTGLVCQKPDYMRKGAGNVTGGPTVWTCPDQKTTVTLLGQYGGCQALIDLLHPACVTRHGNGCAYDGGAGDAGADAAARDATVGTDAGSRDGGGARDAAPRG